MTEDERDARWARLERRWNELSKETKERLAADLDAHLGRMIEGDRPRQAYIEKARSVGNLIAAQVAKGLEEHDFYERAAPATMPAFVEQLRPIPNPRGRPKEWTDKHVRLIEAMGSEVPLSARAWNLVHQIYPNLARSEAKGRIRGLVRVCRAAGVVEGVQ